ncbi:MAG: hypothetical protein ACRD2U_10415 [Terriglobales bacterium]
MSERITMTPAWACPARKRFCRSGLSMYPGSRVRSIFSRNTPPYSMVGTVISVTPHMSLVTFEICNMVCLRFGGSKFEG